MPEPTNAVATSGEAKAPITSIGLICSGSVYGRVLSFNVHMLHADNLVGIESVMLIPRKLIAEVRTSLICALGKPATHEFVCASM